MTFGRLYNFSNNIGRYPIIIEGKIDAEAKALTAQDELYYIPVELDESISLGHIKQYRIPSGVYDGDPTWVSEIRYSDKLNTCWKRYVCCKELMHLFDNAEERSDTAEKFSQLLSEIEAPVAVEQSSPMYGTEVRTLWMAIAILCPESIRNHFKPKWDSKEISDYDVALELRIPELLIKTIMGSNYDTMLGYLKAAYA